MYRGVYYAITAEISKVARGTCGPTCYVPISYDNILKAFTRWLFTLRISSHSDSCLNLQQGCVLWTFEIYKVYYKPK